MVAPLACEPLDVALGFHTAFSPYGTDAVAIGVTLKRLAEP
jgi:hypothetical protein